jgi:hypothetical protein
MEIQAMFSLLISCVYLVINHYLTRRQFDSLLLFSKGSGTQLATNSIKLAIYRNIAIEICHVSGNREIFVNCALILSPRVQHIRFQIVKIDMTINWKALDEGFLMVPFVFRLINFWWQNGFSEFLSKKPQSFKRRV